MKASWLMAFAAGATLALAAPPEVEAQSRSQRDAARQQQERREAERERLRRQRDRDQRGVIWQDERDRRRDSRNDDDDDDNRSRRNGDWGYERGGDDDDDDDDDNRRSRNVYGRNGNGPAFCRSGEGHPVYGRQWCRDRGYGVGNERTRDIWGDIIFRQPRDRRYENRSLNRSTLSDILGGAVLGRFENYGRQYRTGSGTVSGRWLPDTRTNALQLYMGSIPIARLVDTNRDGRVDSVQLR